MPRKGPISGRTLYTAEELLKKNPLTGQLKREIEKIEKENEARRQKNKKEKNKKVLNVKDIINTISSKFADIETHYNGYEHVIKYKGKNLCYVSQRRYGVAVVLWDKGMKHSWTERLVDNKDITIILKKLEERKWPRKDTKVSKKLFYR